MKKSLVKTLWLCVVSAFAFSLYGCGNDGRSDDGTDSLSPSFREVAMKVDDEEAEYLYFSYDGEELYPAWETVIDMVENSHSLLSLTAGEKRLTMEFASRAPNCDLAYMFTRSKSGNTSSYREEIFQDFQTEGNKYTAAFSVPETLREDNELLFVVIAADWGEGINGEYFIGFRLV